MKETGMKKNISGTGFWLTVLVLAAVFSIAPLWADGGSGGQILMEYVGQVINGSPTPTSSDQFGNLQAVSGVDPSLLFTFYTQAETVNVVANGPLRIIDRTGTTTIYLTSTPGDFSDPDSFRSGTPVQVSTLRQQVIVDTSTGAFSVVNINTIASTTKLFSGGKKIQLGEAGQSFRTVLNGHLNTPGMSPTGWFGGYAVRTKN
jgi:hypothetical protein